MGERAYLYKIQSLRNTSNSSGWRTEHIEGWDRACPVVFDYLVQASIKEDKLSRIWWDNTLKQGGDRSHVSDVKGWQIDSQGCWREMEFDFTAPKFEIVSGITLAPL